jgi:hypothetical protein
MNGALADAVVRAASGRVLIPINCAASIVG